LSWTRAGAGAFDCFPMGLAKRINAEGKKLLTNFLAL